MRLQHASPNVTRRSGVNARGEPADRRRLLRITSESFWTILIRKDSSHSGPWQLIDKLKCLLIRNSNVLTRRLERLPDGSIIKLVSQFICRHVANKVFKYQPASNSVRYPLSRLDKQVGVALLRFVIRMLMERAIGAIDNDVSDFR